MSNPQLSIVIPTHNTCELTLSCLRSIERQDGPTAEVIVVDDGSRDETVARIRQDFPGVRLLVQEEPPRSFTRSANRGLRRAKGSLVLLLNSDTELEPGALAALGDAFEKEPALGIAGARLFYPDGRRQWSGGTKPTWVWFFLAASGVGELLNRSSRFRALRPVRGHRSPIKWVTGASLAVRREVVDQVGLLDERFRLYAQDLDFCLRAIEEDWEVRILEDFHVLHHHGATVVRAAGGDTVERHQPALMWADLLSWANKHHSTTWASFAACFAAAGLLLRSGYLRLESLWPWSEDRQRLRIQARLLGRLCRSLLRHRYQFPVVAKDVC